MTEGQRGLDDIFGEFQMPEDKEPVTSQQVVAPSSTSDQPGADSYTISGGISYDYDPNKKVLEELKEMEAKKIEMTDTYSRIPKGRGETVAKVASPIGIAAAVVGLLFLGFWAVDVMWVKVGTLAAIGCLMLPLGALLSVAGVVLAIIALALGAGVQKSKAVFAIIFSMVYWVMFGAWFLMVFVVAIASASGS
ncbi:MAG: hypothetical protein ACMUIE_07055 [Thermoplasmatota archaeon]